ncbi:hypothetical protein GF357_01800 [Candidatus Dojkabacteria bacterium]|nr:hypothetical protein [Candidatus Dojkabacteria bacterium]
MAKKSKKAKSIKINVAPFKDLFKNFKKSKFYKSVSEKLSKKDVKSSIIWAVVFIVTLIVMDYAFQYYNNDYTAVVVNGERVSRSKYLDKVNQEAGAAVSELLIKEILIRQEAEKYGITVDESEIEEVLSDYYEYYGGKEAFLSSIEETSGLTIEDFKKKIETELLAMKTATRDIEVTDDQLKEFFENVKGYMFAGEEDPKFEENKDEVKEMYMLNKYQEIQMTWLSELRANANIANNVTEDSEYGFLQATINGIRGLYNDLFNRDSQDNPDDAKNEMMPEGSDQLPEAVQELLDEEAQKADEEDDEGDENDDEANEVDEPESDDDDGEDEDEEEDSEDDSGDKDDDDNDDEEEDEDNEESDD